MISDKRVVITSNMEGLQNMTVGALEAFVTSSSAALVADICKEKHFGTAMGTFGTLFDIGHASGPILAGFLIARYDYLYSFWMMSALLVVAIPVFTANVKTERDTA